MRQVWMCLGAAAVAAMAAAPLAAAEVPEGLRVDGAPIDPLCFQNTDEQIAVRDCLEEGMAVKDPDSAEPGSGWVERIYQYTDMEPDTPGSESSAGYRYLGEVPQGMALETRFWGGGTGQFSSVMIVTRQGDTLDVVAVPFGGDRCNGGLSEVAVQDGALRTEVAITPYDLLSLALDGEPPVEPYDDIAACAICCVGTAVFRDDTLTGVTLGPNDEPTQAFADSSEPGPQSCLDDLIAKRGAFEAPVSLDLEALHALGADFKARCVETGQ